VKTYAITDVGQLRDNNQDYIYCNENPVGAFPNLFIVADGMGGHRAGDFASRFCVEEFARRVSESDEMTVVGTIERALRETNEQLIIQAKEHTELDGMGTTFVMAVINGDDMIVANIGDSRLYRMDQDLHQITEDHSLVAEMVRNGDIEREEARFHPNKNIVTRALSTTGIVLPDFFEIRLHAEDIVLLCSDGLFTMLEDSEIEDIINCNRDNLEKAGKELVEKANAGGGKDNISLILVKKDGR